jgi:hypothetical protein
MPRFAIAAVLGCTAATIDGLSFIAAAEQPQQTLRMVIQSHPNSGRKCLDVPKAQYVVGVRLQIFGCNNQAEEIFAYDQGTRRLVTGHLCVESWGRGEAADAVGLGVCTDAPNQQWRAAASGDYYLFAGMNNRCLAIKAIAKEDNAALEIANCAPSNTDQLWALIAAPNAQPGKCTHLSLRA